MCIDQSKVSKLLAVGSSQGHLFIYNSFTSSRATISSKHTRRITSLQFTYQSDHIVTLSPELLCVTNAKGDTIAQLRQKQIGGYFLNRVLAVQIKAGDRKYDAVVFLALLSAEL